VILFLKAGILVIQSFGDSDTKALFNRERIKKLHPDLFQRARSKLLIINAAVSEDDLRVPLGNNFEKLKGDKKGWCSIRINNQWRVIFKWAEGNASDVTITDYH